MDEQPQANPDPVTRPASASTTNKVSASHHAVYSLVSLIILIAGMAGVYYWQHQKVNQLTGQLNNDQTALIKDSKISLDNLTALTALPNIVVDSANSPTDLIAFLGADNTECYKGDGSGYYKVIAEDNDQFAKMQYGCTAKGGTTPLGTSTAYILGKKVSGKWSLISPTNQWLPVNSQDLPSCTMVNDNKVSKLITSECWQGPAFTGNQSYNPSSYTAVAVTNP